jgi:hypothetical protein
MSQAFGAAARCCATAALMAAALTGRQREAG